MAAAVAADGGEGLDPGSAQGRRHQRGAAVDGPGRRPDQRYPGRGRDRAAHRRGGGRDPGAAPAEGVEELDSALPRSSPRKRGPSLKRLWIPACAGMSGGESLESFKAGVIVMA